MSEEDDELEEHYFLQPVKGYNIIEKIKTANEQLFELEIPYNKSKRPKVSFRENLVDFEPEFSSDDGYGESGTSTSDHESKNVEQCQESICEEECDLERELEKLRSFNVNKADNGKVDSDLDDDIKEEVEENIQDDDGDECVCERDQYEDEHFSSEDDAEVDDNDNCNKCTMEEQNNSCMECDMVEKLVAELVVKDMDEDKKPTPPPPKKAPAPKKAPYKLRGGRRFRNEDSNFEVIETEHGRFRGCCRHKAESVEGMPQYEGALSLYGLSERQYERRDNRLQKQEEKQHEKFEKLKEEYKEKCQQNEDAFASWLKNKSRTPQNRTKNMYDVKRKPQKRGSIKSAPKKFRTNDNFKVNS